MTDRIMGIVGGTGPESTIDYYRSIVASWQRRRPDGTFPRLIVNSVEAGRVFRHLGEGDFGQVADILGQAIVQLAAAGAGCALLASNATHLAFDQIAARSPLPLIHIVDAARDEAVAGGQRRLGLIGTRFVMDAAMYPQRFGRAGIDIVVPSPDERAFIHEAYFGELVPGIVLDSTRRRLVSIIAEMRDRDAIDGLILGGTELALILTGSRYADVPILDTARVHAERAVDWLLGDDHPLTEEPRRTVSG
jgi:aspartate racemase